MPRAIGDPHRNRLRFHFRNQQGDSGLAADRLMDRNHSAESRDCGAGRGEYDRHSLNFDHRGGDRDREWRIHDKRFGLRHVHCLRQYRNRNSGYLLQLLGACPLKRILLLVLAISSSAWGQVSGSLTAANQCVQIGALSKATVGIYVSGTFSASLQPQGTIQGQAAFNAQVAPSTSTTLASTITSGGAYVAAVAGYSTFQVCVSAYTSGTAVVWLQASENQLGSTIGGGSTPFVAPLTTKGDLFTFTTVNARLGVGSNGQCLTAQSGQTTGLLWASCGGGAPGFDTIATGTNTSAAMLQSTTATFGWASGSRGAPSVFWTVDGPNSAGFFKLGGANDVGVWTDNTGLGGDLWGWNGQNTGALFVLDPNGFIGFGSGTACTSCFARDSTTGALAASSSGTSSGPYVPLNASQFLLKGTCTSAGGTCGTNASGFVTIAAAATTVTIATTAVHTNPHSHIHIQEDSTLGTLLTVTCNTTVVRSYQVTAVTDGVSFVVTSSAAPSINPACLSFTLD